jgi:hypothetical protein
LANSNCDIVSETSSVDATITGGKLSSFGGCCGVENCDSDLESTLGAIKNKTCTPSGNNPGPSANETSTAGAPTDFSCICDQNDMATLFDLSVERGVQWFQTAIGDGGLSNGSNVYENTARLRKRMSGFCSNNMCNANTIVAAGVAIPSNAFPVCVHLVRADTGKAVRGCTFAPKTVPPKDAVRRVQSSFPANPIAGAYDHRVAVNASNQYSFIFECRVDMCNERQYYENLVRTCLPGVEVPTIPGGGAVAVEPSGPAVGGGAGTGASAGTTPIVLNSTSEMEASTAAGPIVVGTGGDVNETETATGSVPPTDVNGTAVVGGTSAGVEVATVETTVHIHNHNLTEPPVAVEGTGGQSPAPTDTNSTASSTGDIAHDASKTGSAVRHLNAFWLVCSIPVIILFAFE